MNQIFASSCFGQKKKIWNLVGFKIPSEEIGKTVIFFTAFLTCSNYIRSCPGSTKRAKAAIVIEGRERTNLVMELMATLPSPVAWL